MNIDGSLDHLNPSLSNNLDNTNFNNPRFSYSVQASNSYEIGSVFQCPVWVDLGENNIADIASILLAKGLDSGIPIEIKLRMSLNCLYIPLTIFAISVFLAVIFLGVLCFYTKTRTFKGLTGVSRSTNLEENNNNNINNRITTITPKPKPLPKKSLIQPATNFLVYDAIEKLNTGKPLEGSKINHPDKTNINTETTNTSQPKVPARKKTRKNESKRDRSSRVNKAMGELMEEDYIIFDDNNNNNKNQTVFQIQNPTIVRHQVSGAAQLCGNQADPISFI